MNAFTQRIEIGPEKNGVASIRLPGSDRTSQYTSSEVPSTAVIVALEEVTRKIARGEIKVNDGFQVKVEFVQVEE